MKSIFRPKNLLLFSALFLQSCALFSKETPPIAERSGEYRVSVSSSGRELKDFSKPLVHRMQITPEQLLEIFDAQAEVLRLPFKGKRIYDNRGGVKGLRIVQSGSGEKRTVLGIRHNDLLTSIGKSHTKGLSDLWILYEALRTNHRATLTL